MSEENTESSSDKPTEEIVEIPKKSEDVKRFDPYAILVKDLGWGSTHFWSKDLDGNLVILDKPNNESKPKKETLIHRHVATSL